MNLGLKGRVALVTGGSQGIGEAVTRAFSREGLSVAFTRHKGVERASSLAGELRKENPDVMALPLDLNSGETVAKITEAVLKKWGRIDILVNNAIEWGPRRIAEALPFEELPLEEWRPLLRANIEGPFRLIQSVLPSMRNRGWGRIVNVSATLAEDGLPGAGWYATAKSSLHGLTRTLSKELGPSGVLINSVMPGLTETARTAGMALSARERVEKNTPIRRILRPEEIANTIVFLCSDANSAITGEIVRVSGGRM
jgi:3-oxoacyl-[acyl-carrier protein] reductase